MPTPTIAIMGSKNVMAPWGLEHAGTFFEGRWQKIRVTGISTDTDSPESVRRGLVGLVVPTIFTYMQMKKAVGDGLNIPKGMRFSYVPDVIDVLMSAEKNTEAEELRKAHPSPLDMYGFEQKIYELV
ncbi:MAG: hypothetical protein AABX54_05580 [Nanoarchaeota archaeon]